MAWRSPNIKAGYVRLSDAGTLLWWFRGFLRINGINLRKPVFMVLLIKVERRIVRIRVTGSVVFTRRVSDDW